MTSKTTVTKKYAKRARVSLFYLFADGEVVTHDEDHIEVSITGDESDIDLIEIDDENPQKLIIAQSEEKQTVGVSLKGVTILGDFTISNVVVNAKPEKKEKVTIQVKVPKGTEVKMTGISGNIVSHV